MIQTQAERKDVAGNNPKAAKLSAYQISELRSEYDRLSLRLENTRENAQRVQSRLSEVCAKEAKAERLLSLTEGSTGFAEQRERAREVFVMCRQRRAELSPLVESLDAAVKRIEEERGRIDTRLFTPVKEIEELARDLRTPLPG
jgi:predicted  nucleic acid-binding Zn-ribbon protein